MQYVHRNLILSLKVRFKPIEGQILETLPLKYMLKLVNTTSRWQCPPILYSPDFLTDITELYKIKIRFITPHHTTTFFLILFRFLMMV